METIITKERENFRNENIFPYFIILPGATPEKWLHPGGSDGKESACNAGDPGSIPGLGRSPGGGNGNSFSILAWRIPWTEEPGGLQSMGLQRAGYD